ncbi:hypothetical protein HYH03_006567 [Edaphochlamys debaryana]|uniref:Diphthine--ammonia ligase n=1 Tax=Edaphochlamys debaryana TaxID=47281 RepID=A0A836C034_9CHLO|nr:hypothetical protein HYH03_006567 [Edaphochlamys debaryana]|eukprot:KAG2495295.1 hypothetical protein HYH03_006567 [Edaphochlamys debaryana]
MSGDDAETRPAMRKAAVSFTGGKDSMTVLHLLRAPHVALAASKAWADAAWRDDLRQRLEQVAGLEVVLLVTFAPAGAAKPFKAHPLDLVKQQAQALGLPHQVVEVSAAPTFLDSYREGMARLHREQGIQVLLTGDMLDVCSNFMPRAAEGSGLQLRSPLWDIDRRLLLEMVWAYGMAPVVTCVNRAKFVRPTGDAAGTAGAGASDAAASTDGGKAEAAKTEQEGEACGGSGVADGGADDGEAAARLLLGHELDRELHRTVLQPAVQMYGIDEAGEWGEFHTMVTRSCLFSQPLRLPDKRLVQREGEYLYFQFEGEAAAK